MDSINGITLQKYAELCVLMADTGNDEAKEIAIAQVHGVSADDWKAAKAGFFARMSDPADMGKTAMAFMAYQREVQEKLRGGGEPGSLEDYVKIHAQMAYRKDPSDPSKKIDFHVVLEEHGYPYNKWLEMENYWTPRVSAPNFPEFDPVLAQKFREMMKQETDKILGGGL